MARKQSEYLADILGGHPEDSKEAPSPTSPERGRPATLLSRESALARVQSGEVRQVTQLLLDPKRVRVWPGNARLYEHLSEENCRELISSIIAEGGQKVPAIVRRTSGDPDHDYEVIAGTRRHWAISWLRRHSYPDLQFLAQVSQLDDEAAFRLADLENRARKDISDVERARNYAAALHQHYGGHVTRMSERLNISKGWLSKTLKVATIPDAVLAAFASVTDLAMKPAYALAQALDDKAVAKAIATAARQIAKEQSARCEAGEPAIPANEVLRRLTEAPRASRNDEAVQSFAFVSRYGRTALSVQSANRNGVIIRLHAGSGADMDELVTGLREALAHLEMIGRGLQH
jgi:ParB family chromosome partitioning protein